MAASDLVKNNLHRIRQQFFPDDTKEFYQQRTLLVKAITTPAAWLEERGVRLSEQRLQEILDTVLTGIMHHGATHRIGYFCAYFLKCVQDHMRFQGERYYEEAKSLRTITETAIEHLTKQQKSRLSDAQDRTTAELSALNRLVRETTAKRPKRAKAPSTQLDLF